MVEIFCVFLARYVGSGPLGVMARSVYIYVIDNKVENLYYLHFEHLALRI